MHLSKIHATWDIFRRRLRRCLRRPTLVVRIRGSSSSFRALNVRVPRRRRRRAPPLARGLELSFLSLSLSVFASRSWSPASEKKSLLTHLPRVGAVTCRRHISSRSPRNRPRTSSASNRTNWLQFYLRRAVLSPLSKSPSCLLPNTFSRF